MKTVILSLFALLSVNTYAQKISSRIEDGKEMTYVYIEKMPEFQGDLSTYIEQHQKHPLDSNNNRITGRVVIRFNVLETGKVADITVVKKVHPTLDKNAFSIVGKMPLWKPATSEGKPVKVPFTIPIIYK